MALSSNIRLYRKKAGLTQTQLANELEISLATLRRWETGETTPTGAKISELANRFGVEPADLVVNDPNESKEKVNTGMLVFENGGTRIELPPTEKGYELFNRLVDELIQNKI